VQQSSRLLLFTCLAGVCLVVYRGWVTEDAFITFRVIDNFVNGYGLRWNIDERVQVFTHPLWLMLHLPFYYVTDNIWLVTQLLSFACSFLAAAIMMRTFDRHHLTLVVLFLLPLFSSRAVMDFTSSGLENPLTFLLFAWFGHVLFHRDRFFWFYVALIPALAMVNRLDTALVYAPVTLWLAFSGKWGRVRWSHVALGTLPLMLWLAFSLFYFGFPFPNTKYAKLNAGVAALDSLHQGLRYFVDLALTDTSSALLLLAGLLAVPMLLASRLKVSQNSVLVAIAAGALAYCGYVAWIGGDFMSGRFLALPTLISAWLILAACSRDPMPRVAFFWPVLLFAAWFSAHFTGVAWRGAEPPDWKAAGVVDERLFYRDELALFAPGSLLPRFSHAKIPAINTAIDRARGADLVVKDTIGYFGLYLGPGTKVLDNLALSDPLLARLPTIHPKKWRIGHFIRRVPRGYIHALETDDTRQMEPHLARYYEKLQLITSADLLAKGRLRAIIDMNLGREDHLLRSYLSSANFRGSQCHLVIHNSGDSPAEVTVIGTTPGRQMETAGPFIVPAGGFFQILANDLFSRQGTPWSLQLESASNSVFAKLILLHGETLHGSPENGFSMGVASPDVMGKRLVMPWVSASREFESLLQVSNPSDRETRVVMTLYRANGKTVSAQKVIGAGQELQQTVAELFPGLQAGGFCLELASEPAEIEAIWTTRNLGLDPGGPMGRATAQAPQQKTLLFPYLPSHENLVSIPVLVNTGLEPANLVLDLIDVNGHVVLHQSLHKQAPLVPRPLLIRSLVPAGSGDLFLRVTSDGPIGGVAVILRNGHEPQLLRPVYPFDSDSDNR